ncbi:MAG: zf-HC2 domain-containing protein [Acidobacteriia bacterium]|nr:zf-HC2 domain-containing protein [Terriglobia bacterium]
MDCRILESLLVDYFDHALDGGRERDVEAHLAQCPGCRALVAEMRTNLLLTSTLPELDPPARLVARIIESTSGARAAPAWYDFVFDFIRPQALPKFAMGSLMTVASLAIVLFALGVNFGDMKAADFSPTRMWERTNRQVHLAYSRGVKYYNALRIVYEIQSRFESATSSSGGSESPTPDNTPAPQNNPNGPSKPGSQRTLSFGEELNTIEMVRNWSTPPSAGGLS